LRQRRPREEPIRRGLVLDRVRRAARDGGQEGLERWRDGLVRPRLEIPLRAPRDELPELLRPGRVLLRGELVEGLQREARIPGVGARVARDIGDSARRAAVVLPQPVWKSKFYGTFVLNRRVDPRHRRDACSMAW